MEFARQKEETGVIRGKVLSCAKALWQEEVWFFEVLRRKAGIVKAEIGRKS